MVQERGHYMAHIKQTTILLTLHTIQILTTKHLIQNCNKHIKEMNEQDLICWVLGVRFVRYASCT